MQRIVKPGPIKGVIYVHDDDASELQLREYENVLLRVGDIPLRLTYELPGEGVQVEKDQVLIHVGDMEILGLAEGDTVEVQDVPRFIFDPEKWKYK